MKIPLRKIGKNKTEFEVIEDKVTFKGFLEYHSNRLIFLSAKLSGFIELNCDICANEYLQELNNDIEFFISDGAYTSSEDDFIEVVEIYDATLDLKEILHSELELIKNEYHICESCDSKNEEFSYTIE